MPTFTEQQTKQFARIVNFIVPIGGMSTDIYLPSLPSMSKYFGVGSTPVQLTLTLFMLALGIGQLIAGPISDAIGRRRLVMGGIILQLCSVLVILFAAHINVLLLMRFIQGLGAAFMMVPIRAVLNDTLSGIKLKKQFNYVMLAFSLGPIVAPFIGGYLQHYYGWRSNFIFIAVYLLMALFFVTFMLKETIIEKKTFSIHHLWQNYHTIFKNNLFVLGSIFAGILWGYTLLFNVVGPYLIQTVMHHTPVLYGYMALLIGTAWFLGGTLNGVLFHLSIHLKCRVALTVVFFTSVVMGWLVHTGYFNLPVMIVPIFIMVMSNGCMFPIILSECLILFPKIAASANALLFAIVWVVISGFTVLGSQLKVNSVMPLAMTFVVTSVISVALYYLAIRRLET